MGYSPWGRKESDMTEPLHSLMYIYTHKRQNLETTTLMYSFPNFEPVSCSMSSSNCCFLTCLQVSWERGKVVWYLHLFNNVPQFVVIHTVIGFSVVNKAEIDVLLEFSCFLDYNLTDAGNLISGSSALSNPA